MRKQIKRGLYLVVNPAMEERELLRKLKEVIGDGIVAVQLWDNFESDEQALDISLKVIDICRPVDVPVIVNNRWGLVEEVDFDGVHFDAVPQDWEDFKSCLSKNFLVGITVNNDLQVAEWAVREGLDYVSFCSIFPSSTANSCDLVAFDSVQELTKKHDIPVFLAGGIRHDNLAELDALDYHGIAVVSGVMSTDDPAQSVADYMKYLKK